MIFIKSKIYRYFGIYLAHKEELRYLTNDQTIENMEDRFLRSSQEEDQRERLSLRNIIGLEIGLWQAKNGFTRKWTGEVPHNYNSWYKNLLIRIKACFINIKMDIIK